MVVGIYEAGAIVEVEMKVVRDVAVGTMVEGIFVIVDVVDAV